MFSKGQNGFIELAKKLRNFGRVTYDFKQSFYLKVGNTVGKKRNAFYVPHIFDKELDLAG